MHGVFIAVLLLYLGTYAWLQTAVSYKTVVLSKGPIQFPLRFDDREQYAYSCPRGICSCESDIEYIRLISATQNSAVDLINRQLRLHANTVKCQYLDSRDFVYERVTHLSRHFVSVVEDFWSQQIDTGGSCHGFSTVHTFNLASGREYTLADIVSRSSLHRLRSSLADTILEGYPGEKTAERQIRQQVESMDDQQLLTAPLFIENGQVYINVEGSYLDCGAGNFHPAEIPPPLILLPSIRHEIGRR